MKGPLQRQLLPPLPLLPLQLLQDTLPPQRQVDCLQILPIIMQQQLLHHH